MDPGRAGLSSVPLARFNRPDEHGRPDSGDAAMSRPLFSPFALALAFALAGGSALAAGSIPRGKEIAEKKCAICHSVEPRGDSPSAKAPPFRTLSQRYPVESLQEALAEGITVGHEGLEMPEFRMEPAQIDDFLAFLKSINR
jgi:cytochrome c